MEGTEAYGRAQELPGLEKSQSCCAAGHSYAQVDITGKTAPPWVVYTPGRLERLLFHLAGKAKGPDRSGPLFLSAACSDHLGVTWIRAPGLASSSIHSEPSG